MTILSTNLKRVRKDLGINQEAVAQYLNISRPAYSQYETGNRNPDWETISSLADFFHVSTDYLLGRTDAKETLNSSLLAPLPRDQQELLALYKKFSEKQRAQFLGYGERVLEEAEKLPGSIYDKKW